MSADCQAILAMLASGMDSAACHDFSAVRRAALCKGWADFESRRAPTFADAVHGAWRDIGAACAAHGGTTPEYGELAAIERHEGPDSPLVRSIEAIRAREADLQSHEDCAVCAQVLQTHCALHGADDPRYCDLWDRYWTDRGMTSDDVLYELVKIETPQQREEVTRALQAKGATQTAPPA